MIFDNILLVIYIANYKFIMTFPHILADFITLIISCFSRYFIYSKFKNVSNCGQNE